ncbi:Crp/Fnr family transcriptional regulator [Labilibaculum euxinus]|uniref:Cyclic nucleotide-binding domain-containing protein n=1 Tax=Labilibaculum euxinus TaxID=2686357 RepID=A0A7M4D6J7_9BACT|nr:Crp/Fnr family transcriptional regulator [Labilibaculum euxinus]MUP38276.1 cyclic nucleotide-binding domain-containing protein [Labilibaculum euxinus]MVB07481.1 cyclic nucleotide-binding domain-containing protein [Labilibaculum euxinus]
MSDSIWCFENINLYQILCPHKLKEFGKDHFEGFKKGDFIYFPEDASQSIFMVSKGKVKIVSYNEDGEEVVKAILGKGEIFGEKALLGEEKRSDYALACSEPTELCPMRLSDMYQLMRTNEKFGFSIYKLIGVRIKKMERRLEALLFKDVRTRLCEFIKEMADENGTIEGTELVVSHFFTQKDFADLIGTSRETVTRLFNELKEEGIIDYSRKEIKILAKEKL